MIYAEVFAGAGGMSLGLERAGLKCAWHSEIELRARRILEKNFPNVALYGDVRYLKGEILLQDHGKIDLLSGGSPCQDLSIAGKRAGLKGTKSILFNEQMRLWDETGAPLCLWENVGGALSSNKGKDFARVLSAFCGGRITVPRHPKSRKRLPWARSGVCVGSTGVAAWRVLDAQFFGVPQRRRRVFILGSRSREYDPVKILLEPKSVYGDFESRISPREKDSATSPRLLEGSILAFHHKQDPDAHIISPPLGITAQGMGVLHTIDKQSGLCDEDITATLKTDLSHQMGPVVVNRMLGFGDYKEDDVASSIKSRDYKDVTDSVLVAINVSDSAPKLEAISSSLTSRESAGGIGAGAQMQGVFVGYPRRFLPIECERLMGWPDKWTKFEGASDTPRYILCGNGCVADQAEWIGRRINGDRN